MTRQIAVRLPDKLVRFLDDLVQSGKASSRAMAVAQAVERERRQALAACDAAILANAGVDGELDALAEFAARTPMDDLD